MSNHPLLTAFVVTVYILTSTLAFSFIITSTFADDNDLFWLRFSLSI